MRPVLAFLFLVGGLPAADSSTQPILPHWIKIGGELRGRAEGTTGIGFKEGADDAYFLEHAWLNVTIAPVEKLRFFVEGQDARVFGYDQGPRPTNMQNTADFRQAWVQYGGDQGWRVRAGRQELIFGEQRLVGSSAWGNVGRTFDALRVGYQSGTKRFDWFASSVVKPVSGQFDHWATNNKFSGFYGSLEIHKATVEPYWLWKSNSHVRDELGAWGDLDIYTWGVRTVGHLPRRFDYNVETAFQTGHAAGDAVRAWGGHWVLGYTVSDDDRAPRLLFEYNYATGDRNPGDGKQGTFDSLYPSSHDKWGLADRVGWRNIHDVVGGAVWKPNRQMRFGFNYHAFWLADLHDAFYSQQGTVIARNSKASSGRIGDEIDLQFLWLATRHVQGGAGWAHIIPGPYLIESGKSAAFSYPYVYWTYRF